MSRTWKGCGLAAMLAGAGLAMAAPAQAATTIGFDDLTGSGDLIENGYAGLDWQNMYVLNPADAPTSGYQNAVVSGDRIAYSGYDTPATIAGLSNLILQSGWFTAAFNDGLTITAQGYAGDDLVHEVSFAVDTKGPRQQQFNWSGISRVTFTATGGTDQFFDMSGTNFALDSLSVAAVPEPATWATMLIGLAMVAGTARRRRTIRAAA